MGMLLKLAAHARVTPDTPALAWNGGRLGYAALAQEVEALTRKLTASGVRVLGLDLDNGPAWALLDLAALAAGVTLVPIPPFFSPQQVRHCLQQAGVQAVISDNPDALALSGGDRLSGTIRQLPLLDQTLAWVEARGAGMPAGCAKVTYTSGTTGEPKGVMLAWEQIQPVVESLARSTLAGPADRHLALMPLAVLLENIGGLYAPLWAGGTAVLPPLVETGLRGAASLDPQALTAGLNSYQATTAIFTPQTLHGLVAAIEQGMPRPRHLRFAAVGGAPVSPRLLERAQRLGLPVFEGYGLSECASVVTLNACGQQRPGSVGKPLPHLRLRIDDSGEVLVAGNLFKGYLGAAAPESADGWWRTGDLGYLDADGFLYLSGRRRNVFITAYGRNVSPEWVERELTLEPGIAQAAVFGEARPWNTAVLVPRPGVAAASLAAEVQRANRELPDYARVSRWIIADTPFTPDNGQLSGTGRVRRRRIYEYYRAPIERLYSEELVS